MSPSTSPQLLSSERLKWIESLRVKYGIPGMAVAVVRGPKLPSAGKQPMSNGHDTSASSGWITQIEAFGESNCRGDSFDKDTIFAIASNSKVFVSLSIALLVERGTKLPNGRPLTWKTKVKDVLGDDWVLPDEYATKHADLDDLAGMRLGMAAHHFGRMPLNPPMPPVQQIRNIRNFTMATELRREFAYDSHCPLSLSHMVPALTGIPYHVFVEEEIFKPLGMLDSYCDSNAARATRRAMDGFLRKGGEHTGKTDAEKLGTPVPVGWWTKDDGFWCLPAGGVAMTMNDGAKLIREFLSPQHLPANVINSRAEPLTPLPSSFPLRFSGSKAGPECYGRGQVISSYRGHTVVWHTGNLPGQSTLIACIPSEQVSMVIAMNDGSIGATMLSPLRCQLFDDLLGLEPTEDYAAKFVKPIMQALAMPPKSSTLHTAETFHLSWAKLDAGTFYHPGYFTLSLQPFDKSTPESEAMIDIAKQKRWFHDLDSSCLVARMHKMWLSHLVFRPLPLGEEGKTVTRPYEWLAYQVYAVTDEDSKPTAECVATCRGRGGAVIVSRGVAMFGGFKDAMVQDAATIDPSFLKDAERVEIEAEVWFARVD